MRSSPSAEGRRRVEVRVRGLVQGVGFRPFAWSLARSHGLCGVVRNGADGVCLEIEGDSGGIDRFLVALQASPPPLARLAQPEHLLDAWIVG